MEKVIEYRGVEDVVIAEILTDDNDTDSGYTFGPVESLLPVAEINKTTETSTETRHYDNRPAITIHGEGADEIGIIGAGMLLEKIAKITGKSYDVTTGAFVDSQIQEKYYALGYKTKDTDGKYRYVWRFKGTFAIPDENHKTTDGSADANGTELTYTGIYTTHKFAKGWYDGSTWHPGPAKGLIVSDREGLADLTNFFKTVTTPDTLTAKKAG